MDTYDDFVAARRSALVEEQGGGAAAEAAVDRALARCRRSWARLEQTTDVEAHVRDLVAEELDRPRRRRLTAWSLAGVAAVAALAVVVSLLPAPPEVREEANPVPVPWYADGELHLAEVVVALPGAGRFAAVDDGVVIEDADDRLLKVDADGDVSDFDEEAPSFSEPDVAAPYDRRGTFSRRVGVAEGRDGAVVHLMELSVSGPDAGVFVRLSESARRVFVVCDEPACPVMRTVTAPTTDARLR
ncbi:hypothetical protein [Nocardioides currus]|nr:hypothetical protein [Nocardioides currus]